MDIRIYPPEEMIEATVELPLSKSISNRALIMNALTPGAAFLGEVANCDDTAAMKAALDLPLSLINRAPAYPVNVGLAGTAMRFLAAYFAALPQAHVELDGNERMRQRPIGPLVDALRACGADIEYADKEGFPPLLIRGKKLVGGKVEMDATVSSQFVSGLLMVAPTFEKGLDLELKGEIASLPYLKMTIEMMAQRGIDVERTGNQVTVKPGYYQPSNRAVERDWSAASYWYEIAATTAGWITLPGLSEESLQGDCKVADIFEKLGIVTEWEDGSAALNPSPEVFNRLEIDLSGNPDLAQTIAVTCCLLGVPFILSGLKSLKIKETDRITALANELAKLSFILDTSKPGVIEWETDQRRPVQAVTPIETYGDHRMAMAFAPVAYFVPGIIIKNAEVVSKSYPEFWDHMRSVGYTIQDVAEAAPKSVDEE